MKERSLWEFSQAGTLPFLLLFMEELSLLAASLSNLWEAIWIMLNLLILSGIGTTLWILHKITEYSIKFSEKTSLWLLCKSEHS
jgi:hypothetical protein